MNYRATYDWTSLVLRNLRQSIEALEFKELVPALCARRHEPGARHSIAVLGDSAVPSIADRSDRVAVEGWKHYYLPVSFVVEKQMALEFLDKVYCLAPCLRLVMDGEAHSGKHLYNFFQFEIEWRTESIDEVFTVGETLLRNVATRSLAELGSSPSGLPIGAEGRRNLEALTRHDYPRVTFLKALEMLGKDTANPKDLTPEDDARLSQMFDRPFWIFDYPEGIRDSIYHRNDRGFYDTYDLMLPFGYGELTTGGIRCKSGAEIVRQSKALGKAYSAQYSDWKDKAAIQTAGFGIGLERLLRYGAGAETILDFIQYHDDGPNNGIDADFTTRKRAKTASGV
jgi:asparaginyl-tRNA synthetase